MIRGELGDMLNAAVLTAEQKSVVTDHYKARLVVIYIGNTFTTGPAEAAGVANKMIKPNAVIVSHANQPSTSGGASAAAGSTSSAN
jgi:hypothetical protein